MATHGEVVENLSKQIGYLQRQNESLHSMDSRNIALLTEARPLLVAYRQMVNDLKDKPANTYGQQYWCEQELGKLDECIEKLRVALGDEKAEGA
jgi:hypothetical protein